MRWKEILKYPTNESAMDSKKVWGDTPPIKVEYIKPTIKYASKVSGIPFEWLVNHTLGSVGKKPKSSDIDVVVPEDVDIQELYDHLLSQLGHRKDGEPKVFRSAPGKWKTLVKSIMPVFSDKGPVIDPATEEQQEVKFDFVFGPVDWVMWAMGSHSLPNYSGAQRGDLIQAVVEFTGNLKWYKDPKTGKERVVARSGPSFQRGQGFVHSYQQAKKGKKVDYLSNPMTYVHSDRWEHPDVEKDDTHITDPQQAVELMFPNQNLQAQDLKKWESLWDAVLEHPMREHIVRRYYYLLQKDKLEIPAPLVDYLVKNDILTAEEIRNNKRIAH